MARTLIIIIIIIR